MPVAKLVTQRIVVLEYDGSNSADILTMANTGMASTVYSIDSEGGGTLVLHSAQPSVWAHGTFETGDFCMAGGSVIPAALFAGQYVVLGDA